jgi:hypothetical protein
MISLLSSVSYTVREKSCLKNTRRKRIRLRENFKFDASDTSRFWELKLHNTHFSGFSPSLYTNLRHYKTEGFLQCDLIRNSIVLRHNSCPFHWNIQQQYKKKFEIYTFLAKCHAYKHACVRLDLNSSKTADNFWKWTYSHLILYFLYIHKFNDK